MKIITKDKIKKLIPEKIILLIMLLIIFKSAFFSYLVIGYLTKKDILLDMVCILGIFYCFQIFFKTKRYLILYFFYLLYSIFLFANILCYREYSDFISISMIKEIFMISKVEGSILSLIKPYDILFVLDLIILFPYIKIKSKKSIRAHPIRSIINSLISIVIIILSILISNYREPNIMAMEFNKKDLYASVGLMGMFVDDSFNYLKNNSFKVKPTKAILNNISKQMRVSKVNNSEYRGRNLIIIQVESLQGFVINEKYNGKEITPNLNKLLKQSAYFTNCYYQIGIGHTSDAELLTNASLYPIEGASAYMVKAGNDYKAIASAMDGIGYYTMAFHGNYSGYWNRGEMYRNYEFDKFYSLDNLKKQEIINMGLADKSFLNQTYNIMKNQKNPFYSFIVTLTSHDPFTCNNNFCKVGNYLSSYYNAINYTDKCIGNFIDKLKKSGLLDKSIVVIYGDHNAIPYGNKSSLSSAVDENLDASYMWQKYQKVPLIVRLPYEKNKGIYTKSVGQIDVFPTILDLYGIKNKKTFGDNIFYKGDDFVVLRDGSYVFGNTYYNNSEKVTYNILNGSKLNNDNNLIDKAYKQLKASDDIFKYNYFKYSNYN